MRTTQIECIVFRKTKNVFEFLLLKRLPEKGGFWQPISGGVEKTDNSLINAAFRELKEEANIQKKDILKIIENIHYFKINKHYLTKTTIPIIKEYVFAFEINPNFKITIDQNLCKEHNEIKWASFENSLKLLKWEDNKIAFKKLNELLT
ncbi:MAG: NUDIX domain-containing protein [Candidatus ainarchaeum sp.]|nr:NUDIX domain-containing protein [Candidatus ainarchaeum sp.]